MGNKIFNSITIPSWSLKQKFHTFVAVSCCIIAVMVGTGAYKHYNFYIHSAKVEANSQKLLSDLAIHFENASLMTEIQADFTIFSQDAHPEHMLSLMANVHQLLKQLPEEAQPKLVHFLNQTGKLEIRMASLRNNNQTALHTGNEILAQLQRLEICGQDNSCLQVIDQASVAYRNVHPLYITDILNGQLLQLDEATQEINQTLGQLIDTLLQVSKTVAPEQKFYLTELRNMFLELDDSITTVGAIKAKVLTTEQDAISTLNEINTIFNNESLTQQKAAIALSNEGLAIARNAGLMMIFTLACFILIILIIGFFLSRGVIAPLVSLVELLQKFSKLLSNIRNQDVNDIVQQAIFHPSLADRSDEIGDVAHATMDLMNHMRSISEFRKKIEDDLSTDEVYSRLATLFEDQLHLRAFVIYEIDKMDAMRPVYFHPSDLEEYLPDLTISARCRAKRTGAVVSSLSDPHICTTCTFTDCLNHICIPMVAGGQVLGVIQLIAPISLNPMVTEELTKILNVAKNYIEEALPVIQAKRLARELEEMATKDQLTGLYNRRYLELSLQQIIAGIKRRNSRLGILMCDMDFFKEVNDTHGHDAGDLVLTNLSAILQESVRESDIVIRFGGEEFLILLVDVNENQTTKVAEKIRAKVEDYTFQLPGSDIKKTLSIGTAEFPCPGTKGVWEVIKQADVALYKAKDSGRNKVVEFSPELWPEKSY